MSHARSGSRSAPTPPISIGGSCPPAWRHALASVSAVTRALFDDGRDVCDVLTGRLRYELRATWLGGVRILDRLDRLDFDVFQQRPTLSAGDALVIGWRALTWKAPKPR